MSVGSCELAYKAMAHVDNDNTIITHAPGREASPAESSLHDRKTPFISHFPGCMRQRAQREHARLTRLSKFLAVGGTGVLVNSLALFILFQWVHLPLVIASALSTELGIVNNFYWNDRWTFGRTQFSLRRFAQFNLVSLAGLVIATCTLWGLVRSLGVYYLAANLLGITAATAWNFAANSFWTWGGVR
jgi:putative flippase GtrA